MADFEPAEDEPSARKAGPEPKGRRPYARMRRELTDEEMSTSGVQKILLDETERLEDECKALRSYTDRYHVADKENAVLHEKLKRQKALDVFVGAALAVGSALIGYSPNAWHHQPTGWIVLVLGGLLTLSGVFAKVLVK